jgi:hypothetical protein
LTRNRVEKQKAQVVELSVTFPTGASHIDKRRARANSALRFTPLFCPPFMRHTLRSMCCKTFFHSAQMHVVLRLVSTTSSVVLCRSTELCDSSMLLCIETTPSVILASTADLPLTIVASYVGFWSIQCRICQIRA